MLWQKEDLETSLSFYFSITQATQSTSEIQYQKGHLEVSRPSHSLRLSDLRQEGSGVTD